MSARRLIGLAASAAFCFYAAKSNSAELILSSFAPPTHTFVAKTMVPWAKSIEDASKGRLTLKLLPQPAASPQGHLDAVRDGVIDITFISPAYYAGKFDLVLLGQLLAANTGEARSVAFQRTFEKFLASHTKDFAGLKLLGFWSIGPGTLFTGNRTVTSEADLHGLKVRVSGGLALEEVNALGMTPVVKPPAEVYEMLSGGLLDGVMFPTQAVCDFKLEGVIKNVFKQPGGLYGEFNIMVMNQASFDALPPEDRAVIEQFSGEALSRLGGHANDVVDNQCWDKLRAAGVKENVPEPAFATLVNQKIEPILDKWKASADAAGVDTKAALAFYQEQLNQQNAEIAGRK